MQLSIQAILSDIEVDDVRRRIGRLSFNPGADTAGWAARSVKQNQQAALDHDTEELLYGLCQKLLGSELFQLAARPKRIVKSMLSRYRPGDHYGWHVDNAIMDGERTDISFTLFLSDPRSYEGGELTIDSAGGTEAIKLPAGSVFVYPSTTLHQVAEVTAGERIAMVGWARSLVRDAAMRELLFDLDTARRAAFERAGKSAEFDLLSKSCANLMRMWCED